MVFVSTCFIIVRVMDFLLKFLLLHEGFCYQSGSIQPLIVELFYMVYRVYGNLTG